MPLHLVGGERDDEPQPARLFIALHDDAAHVLDAIDDPFREAETHGEILEIARRAHHHREGDRRIDHIHRRLGRRRALRALARAVGQADALNVHENAGVGDSSLIGAHGRPRLRSGA